MLYCIAIAIKHTRKDANRLPALPVIIKLPSLGKIRLVKFNIRDHQKMCVQILAHIVKMRLGGYQIRTLLRPLSAQKFRGIFHR